MAGELYLIRHGQASAGAADYDQLSPLGLEQSRLLGSWFGDLAIPVTHVLTGKMKRHRQTANAFLAALPPDLHPAAAIKIDGGFDEYDRGDVVARYKAAAGRRLSAENEMTAAVRRWVGGRHDADYNENWPAFRRRCLATLGRIEADGTTVVFTSSGAISAICQSLLAVPKPRLIALASALVNSAITRLHTESGRITLQTFNSFPHLEIARRSELVTLR